MPDIHTRICKLRIKAANRYNIAADKCHIGHIALEGLLEKPDNICQIDGATDLSETNQSVALRSMRLASALHNLGLKPGDAVIIMAPNVLDLAIPYYACHFMGYSMCCIDPSAVTSDMKILYPYIKPKVIFTLKDCLAKNKEALQINDLDPHIVTFDDKENDLQSFIELHKGSEQHFRPATFDTANIAAWLMLTSGTTGAPKVAVIPFDTLLNGIIEWWVHVKDHLATNMLMTSPQWLSSLVFFISTPIKSYIRLQSSQPFTPQLIVQMISKYRPEATAWTPFLLARFVQAPNKICDLSCFKFILVGGSTVEKHILDGFKKLCNATILLAYGMTELLVGIFDGNTDHTNVVSCGKALDKYKYRLIDDNDQDVTESHKNGELWVKGDAFFKGYLNNPEETSKVLTEDGWLKTGDIFFRDDDNYYYYVDRKKLLIRYLTSWVSPLQIEEVIKKHPQVSEACVVGLSNPETMEIAVAAVMKKNGAAVNPQEIFDLVKSELPETKHLHGGLFFVESYPTTPSGKVNRSKVVDMARTTERIYSK